MKKYGKRLIDAMETPESPVRKLHGALLQLVFRHKQRCHRPKCAVCREDTKWIASEEEYAPFAFITVCEILHVDYRFIREEYHKLSLPPQIVINPPCKRGHPRNYDLSGYDRPGHCRECETLKSRKYRAEGRKK